MRIASVTRRRGARLVAQRRAARSHVLVKDPGGLVTVSWGVTNTGVATGKALLRINDLIDQVPLATIGPVGILAGMGVTLQAVWTVPSTGPSFYSCNTDVLDTDAGTQLAFHDFTVTVPEEVLPPVLGPLDLFFAPSVNWVGNPLQLTWFEEIRVFYGMSTIFDIELRIEDPWVIFFVTSLLDVTQNLGQTPQIVGLNA